MNAERSAVTAWWRISLVRQAIDNFPQPYRTIVRFSIVTPFANSCSHHTNPSAGRLDQFAAINFAWRKLVFITPDPRFSRLDRTDQWMSAAMEVLRGMLVF